MKRLRIPCNLEVQNLLERTPATFEGFKIDKVHFVCDAIYKGSLTLDGRTNIHPLKKTPFYVPLSSDILRHYLGANYYKKIINWMISVAIIESDDSFQNNIVSVGYRFTEQYRSALSHAALVTDRTLGSKAKLKKVPAEDFEESESLPILKGWVSGLTIERQDALSLIERMFEADLNTSRTERQRAKVIAKYNNNCTVVDIFEDGPGDYFFQDAKGRRLHTILSRLPKYLRPFVKYNGQALAQTDLSNSQLFFTLYLLNANNWKKDSTNQTNRIWKDLEYIPSSSYSIMSLGFDAQGSNKQFRDLVCNGTIYDHFVARMESEDGFFNPDLSYDQKRKAIKRLLIAQINGDYSVIDGAKFFNFKAIGTEPERRLRGKKRVQGNLGLYTNKNQILWDAFCSDFPDVADLYRRAKLYNNGDLSRLLQRIESMGVLDFACQEIGKESPETPLFTLHDCLITTVERVDQIDALFKSAIARYLGYQPHTKTKHWSFYRLTKAQCSDDWNEAA